MLGVMERQQLHQSLAVACGTPTSRTTRDTHPGRAVDAMELDIGAIAEMAIQPHS